MPAFSTIEINKNDNQDHNLSIIVRTSDSLYKNTPHFLQFTGNLFFKNIKQKQNKIFIQIAKALISNLSNGFCQLLIYHQTVFPILASFLTANTANNFPFLLPSFPNS